MSKERPFEDITPVPNIKVGYHEKEAYLEIIDRQAKQIDNFAYTIMALQSRIDILEKNKRTQDEWIPVSEQEPDVGGIYLVTAKMVSNYTSDTLTVGTDIARRVSDNIWTFGGEELKGTEIIAWMPLPEPYEETKDE